MKTKLQGRSSQAASVADIRELVEIILEQAETNRNHVEEMITKSKKETEKLD